MGKRDYKKENKTLRQEIRRLKKQLKTGLPFDGVAIAVTNNLNGNQDASIQSPESKVNEDKNV